MDVMGSDSGGGVRDASFQEDPEYFEFSCLTAEETWNFLDSQARDVAREIKVLFRAYPVSLFPHQDGYGLITCT